MPILSIVIPVYNSQDTLGDCITSILNQSFNDYEIILINDGSTDQSEGVCESFAKKDNRVSYFTQTNQGVSAARNRGITLSNGKYIMFVDSDDLLPLGILAKFFDGNDNIDFILSGYSEFVGEPTRIIKSCNCVPLDGSIENLCMNVKDYLDPPLLLGPCFKRFKKELITKMDSWFPLDMSYGEDAVFVLNYLLRVSSVKCIEADGYLYRKDNQSSLSSKYRADKLDINMSLTKQIDTLMRKYSERNANDVFNWNCVRFFDGFTTELMLSKTSYRESERIFREQALLYDIRQRYNASGELSFVQMLRKRSISSRFCFMVMFIMYRCKKRILEKYANRRDG